jgi:hypothetical protein
MIDKRNSGMRCRAKATLHSHSAMVQSGEQGTINYEVENLGRRMFLVEWDNGSSMFAFPDEIEIVRTPNR